MKNPDPSHLFTIAQNALEEGKACVVAKIEAAIGSTPRDKGAKMLVFKDTIAGTIGGGQLELIATQKARELLANQETSLRMEIPLGPEIGQCCGGRVALSFNQLTSAQLSKLELNDDHEFLGKVQIHGAGHTGKALANALQYLPFDVELVDTRKALLSEIGAAIKISNAALPEENVKRASSDTAFVIFTHAHHLDFLIAGEALKRGDAAYVGMIGSKTKLSVFKNWLEGNGYQRELADHLTCPIGGSTVKDKRPEVIAALVVAELLEVFSKDQIRE